MLHTYESIMCIFHGKPFTCRAFWSLHIGHVIFPFGSYERMPESRRATDWGVPLAVCMHFKWSDLQYIACVMEIDLSHWNAIQVAGYYFYTRIELFGVLYETLHANWMAGVFDCGERFSQWKIKSTRCMHAATQFVFGIVSFLFCFIYFFGITADKDNSLGDRNRARRSTSSRNNREQQTNWHDLCCECDREKWNEKRKRKALNRSCSNRSRAIWTQ